MRQIGDCQDCGKKLGKGSEKKGTVFCIRCACKRFWNSEEGLKIRERYSQERTGPGNPMFGKEFTEEHKRALSLGLTGRAVSQETREKLRKQKGWKHTEEAKERMHRLKDGPNHWNWKGGITDQKRPREFNKELKLIIRKRDGFLCQHPLCYKPEYGRAHCVHHIDYNKANNNHNNLITLCNNHHCVTNVGNRDYWTSFYQESQAMRGIL